MTSYVLRKDADDFTRQLIREGHDIEIVDEMPAKFSRPHKFVCKCSGGMVDHEWNGQRWVCMKCGGKGSR